MAHSAADSDEAKRPHNATFARLGRSVWFTLEHSNRANGKDQELKEGLAKVQKQNDSMQALGLSWMAVGNFEDRRVWSDDEWIAFLRTWQVNATHVFRMDTKDDNEATKEETQLFRTFYCYWCHYAALPATQDPEKFLPGCRTLDTAKETTEQLLANFERRLGDPLAQCNKCQKCALGKKMMRCSQCQSALYCSRECQTADWKRHKKACRQNSKN